MLRENSVLKIKGGGTLVRAKGILGVILRPGKYYRIMDENLKKQLAYNPTKRQVRWCYWDFLGFRLKYFGSIDDYFKSQMYRKSDFVRRESLSRYIRFPWRDALQKREYWSIFQDKREFYEKFSEYLHREWIFLDADTSWDDYIKFIEKCSYQIFAKEPKGFGGKQVCFYHLEKEKEQERLFKICKKTPMIIEGRLSQCEELYSFSNSSVNTLRIITLIDNNGKAHVASAVLRMGRGKGKMDNFSSGGMGALVDIDTGIICTVAKDGNGREYIIHPDSGKQIVGYRIEDWENYKAFALELAYKFPEMRYVGWDIIKDSNGKFCVIEGNKDAGSDVMECMLSYGLLPYYEAILKGE